MQFPLSDILRSAIDGLRSIAIKNTGNATVVTVHHTNASQAGAGTDAPVTGCKTAAVQIAGTAASCTVSFWGSINGTDFFPLTGDKSTRDCRSSKTTITDLAHNTEGWFFEVEGLAKLRVQLDQVAGGGVGATSMAQV